MTCSYSCCRTDDGVNFKQFMRTLARFRPIKDKGDKKTVLNSREEKLRCKQKIDSRVSGGNFGSFVQKKIILINFSVRVNWQ